MADLSPYVIALGDRNYPTINTNFLNYLQPFLTEIENARGGQASIISRIQQCVVSSVGFTQDMTAGGFRLRYLPVPIYADEPATKAFAEGLAFASVLPAQAGNAGALVTTDGAIAGWTTSQGVTISTIKRAQRRSIQNFIK